MADLYEKSLKEAQPIQRKMEENMFNIRKLDIQSQLNEHETKKKLAHMVSVWKKISKEEKKRQYEAVEQLFAKAKELSDEKIRLAEKTYEMVDGFIQKLDKDTEGLNVYMEQLKGMMQSPTVSNDEMPGSSSGRRQGTAPASSMKKGGSLRRNFKEEPTSSMDSELASESVTPHPLMVAGKCDMPVDPNEPRYCYCNQVSFGNMVACDNKNCNLEWFHFDCVRLKASPKGKWFCPDCREDKDGATMKRQMKTPKSSRGKGCMMGSIED